jgi:hypothetical protein
MSQDLAGILENYYVVIQILKKQRVMMWIGSNPLRRAFIVGLFSIKE